MPVACLTLLYLQKLGVLLMNINKGDIDCWFGCQYKAYFGAQPELMHEGWMLIKENVNLPDGIEAGNLLWVLMHHKLYVSEGFLTRLARSTEKKLQKWFKILQHLLNNALNKGENIRCIYALKC